MNKLADNLSHVETEVGNLRNTVDGVTVYIGGLSLRGEPSVEQPRPSVATDVLQTLPNNNAERQSHSCTASNPAGTYMHHPSKLWVEQVPRFEGRYGENPISFLKGFEEYASVFGLPDADLMHCLPLSFRNNANYWWEMNEFTVHAYNMGRHPEDLSTFREDLLAYEQIDRLQRIQNNSDQGRQSPPDRRLQYPDHAATASRPPPRCSNNLHVRDVRTAPYSQGDQGGWRDNFCKTRGQGYRNNWWNGRGNKWSGRRRHDSDSNSEPSGGIGTDERDNKRKKTDHEEQRPHRGNPNSSHYVVINSAQSYKAFQGRNGLITNFIRHARDASEPIADLQGNTWQVPYCQVWSNRLLSGATANEHTSEARVYIGLWSLAYRLSSGCSKPRFIRIGPATENPFCGITGRVVLEPVLRAAVGEPGLTLGSSSRSLAIQSVGGEHAPPSPLDVQEARVLQRGKESRVGLGGGVEIELCFCSLITPPPWRAHMSTRGKTLVVPRQTDLARPFDDPSCRRGDGGVFFATPPVFRDPASTLGLCWTACLITPSNIEPGHERDCSYTLQKAIAEPPPPPSSKRGRILNKHPILANVTLERCLLSSGQRTKKKWKWVCPPVVNHLLESASGNMNKVNTFQLDYNSSGAEPPIVIYHCTVMLEKSIVVWVELVNSWHNISLQHDAVTVTCRRSVEVKSPHKSFGRYTAPNCLSKTINCLLYHNMGISIGSAHTVVAVHSSIQFIGYFMGPNNHVSKMFFVVAHVHNSLTKFDMPTWVVFIHSVNIKFCSPWALGINHVLAFPITLNPLMVLERKSCRLRLVLYNNIAIARSLRMEMTTAKRLHVLAHTQRCPYNSEGFLGDLPFTPPLHSGAAPYSPRFTLIDSQDLDVKSHPLHSLLPSPLSLHTGASTVGSLAVTPHLGSYGIRKVFPCKFSIGSEACRAGLINCDPIAKNKIEVKLVYTEVDFVIGTQFITTCLGRLLANTRLAGKQVAIPILPDLKGLSSLACCQLNPRNTRGSTNDWRDTWKLLRDYETRKCIIPKPIPYSPHTKANRFQTPAGSLPDFRKWESCRTMPLVGGFSRVFPVSPASSFRHCSMLTSISLIGS
ncbi:hypothetical protein PR048_010131 [Dryococelus australis]|uniref:Uncharacterized protein n=1 Tax=Dryococelus australis TaxID=614101 RepID=A0ABQ9I1Z5_9NEOP|nr:hypothetical protein PR048_010131 [Dryococelus australis]